MSEPRGDETDEEADIRLGIASNHRKEVARKHIPTYIRERVFQAIGHASMCWETPEKAGVFDTEQASEIATELCQFVMAEKRKWRSPL